MNYNTTLVHQLNNDIDNFSQGKKYVRSRNNGRKIKPVISVQVHCKNICLDSLQFSQKNSGSFLNNCVTITKCHTKK